MNTRFSILCWVFLALAPALSAQSQNPSMTPGASDSGSKNPFGVKLLGGERPKNARTEITATKQATFDNEKSVAEFEGSVVVTDPQFKLYCEKLRVTLNKDRKGLELVEAFGKVVIVQESADAKGDKVKSIGRAEKAVYEPGSGNITLSIWPQVQHGINNQVATEEGTIMKLNREGKSQTIGPSKTMISDSGNGGLN